MWRCLMVNLATYSSRHRDLGWIDWEQIFSFKLSENYVPTVAGGHEAAERLPAHCILGLRSNLLPTVYNLVCDH